MSDPAHPTPPLAWSPRWWPAAAAALVCALSPMGNPDLFWHLAAGRRILASHQVPTRDWLSFTRPNAPWTDFEWLPQVIYAALDGVGGLAAIFALKVALVLAIVAVQSDHLRRVARYTHVAVAGAVVAAAGLLTASDIRPDLFSVLCFAAVWHVAERARRERAVRVVGLWVPLFAAWSNLHAGFVWGVAVLGVCAAQTALPARWGGEGRLSARACMAALAAFAGTLIHPHPVAQYQLLAEVSRDLPMISRFIQEWGPMPWSDPNRLPFWCVLVALVGAAVQRAQRTRSLPALTVATLAYLAVNSVMHARMGVYFLVAAVPFAVGLGAGSDDEEPEVTASSSGARVAVGCVVAALALVGVNAAVVDTGRRIFRWDLYPVQAAGFLASQSRVLGGDGLYHPWHWGGYLGLRLFPRYRVFFDGRYIFHAMLPPEKDAGRDPARWQRMMDRYGVRVAVMPAADTTLTVMWRGRDGAPRPLALPYDMVFMHPSRWALVYWDDVTRVFVRRAAFDARWVDAHEYRVARPGIPPELQSTLGDAARFQAEAARHQREVDAR